MVSAVAGHGDPEELWERARVIAGQLNMLYAELAEVTAAVIEAQAWGGQGGVRSPEHWLMLRAGLSPATAAQVTALARSRSRMPALTGLVDQGRLSLDQASTIAVRVPAGYAESVCEIAPLMTVTQLRRAVGRYAFDPDPGTGPEGQGGEDRGVDAGRAVEPSQVSLVWDEGRLLLRGDLDALDGAMVENAVREAKDALFTAGDSRAGLADALVEMASRSLAGVHSPARAAHYRVLVHLDTEGAWLNARGSLAVRIAERLGCVADAAVAWHRDGKPVSVGRTRRAIPERTRRLVEDRDRGCAYPGCTAGRFVEIHHVRHRQDGGGHDYDNLLCLCPRHHRAHHAGDFHITPGTDPRVPFVFTARHGWTIQVPPRDPTLPSDPTPPRDRSRLRDPAPRTGPLRPTPGRPRPPDRPPDYTPPLGERADYGAIVFRRQDLNPPHDDGDDDAAGRQAQD